MAFVSIMVKAALASDIASQAKAFQAAIIIKLEEFRLLTRSLGVEHPQSREILSRLLRMADGVMGEDRLRWKKATLRGVHGILARYHWEVELKESMQGEELGESNAVVEWDEQWVDSEMWVLRV